MPATKKQQQQAKLRQEKPKGKAAEPREVLYEKVKVEVRTGDNAIKASTAKKLLGWTEETEKGQFKGSHLPIPGDVKVQTANNDTNRPLYMSVITVLMQEILQGRWVLNGEPIIIGKTGRVLNGQHTLIALILAVLAWEENPDHYPAWPSEPTIDKLIVYGIDETDSTVNTMDTCKPRSLSDVIYRAHYFKGIQASAQRKVASLLEKAIQFNWKRSGTHENAFAPIRTHSEAIAFLDRHPKLLACVRHIYEEDNNENKIGRYFHRGYAAGAMYLMGSCNSDPHAYYLSDTPNEKALDWKYWEKAEKFFVELASLPDNKTLKAVHDYITKKAEEGADSNDLRFAVLAKAWNAYKDDKPITAKTVDLQFVSVDGRSELAEAVLFGGIDVGDEGVPEPVEPKEEQEARKQEVKAKKQKAEPQPEPQEAHRAGPTWKKGDKGWVLNGEFEEVELVTLSCDPFSEGDDERVYVDAKDGNWEVHTKNLSLKQFEMVQ
jgi:hypothetical protein